MKPFLFFNWKKFYLSHNFSSFFFFKSEFVSLFFKQKSCIQSYLLPFYLPFFLSRWFFFCLAKSSLYRAGGETFPNFWRSGGLWSICHSTSPDNKVRRSATIFLYISREFNQAGNTWEAGTRCLGQSAYWESKIVRQKMGDGFSFRNF